MIDKNKIFENIHYIKYKYYGDATVNELAKDLIDTLESNYFVDKNQLNSYLQVTENKVTKYGEDATRLTTSVTSSIICRDNRIPKKELKSYLCNQFGYQLEHLNEDVSKIIKKKSDLDSEEKKMIKFIKKELGIKSLDELKKWYDNYQFEQKRLMNESLDRYYRGRF